MFSPEIKSSDLFVTTLVTLSNDQRKKLFSFYSLGAKHTFESAAHCKKIAIGAFAAMVVTGFVSALQQNRVSAEPSEQGDKTGGSLVGAFCILSFLATVFFAYQYISLDFEGNRLADLSEFVVEWVQA